MTKISRRQELYDQIRKSSRSEFILEEMIRLGFWSSEEGKPSLPEQLIREEGTLNKEFSALLKQQRKFQNKERLLNDIRKKRMAEAKAKREETKKKRAANQLAKAKAWKESKAKDILFLGEDFSKGLNNKTSNRAALEKNKLPYFENVEDLSKAMKVSVGTIRYFAFSKKTSAVNHYTRFAIPKKSGEQRLISAPVYRLKQIQYWILENILSPIEIHKAAHGFVPNRSIVSNAKKHVGADVVVNMDLKNFFPTVTYKRIKGVFQHLGYSEQLATIFGLLCTEPKVAEVELDQTKFYLSQSERFLPQGAPTSPYLTNILCYKMDRRFEGLADKLNFNYTRYADDLTFSGDQSCNEKISRLIACSKLIVREEGFKIHPDKLHVMRKNNRQEVTGIVVNEKLNIRKRDLKKFRATLFRLEQDGVENIQWGNGGHPLRSIWAYANYVAMVHPEKGKPLVEKTKSIFDKNPAYKKVLQTYRKKKKEIPQKSQPEKSQIKSTNTKAKYRKPWWKIF